MVTWSDTACSQLSEHSLAYSFDIRSVTHLWERRSLHASVIKSIKLKLTKYHWFYFQHHYGQWSEKTLIQNGVTETYCRPETMLSYMKIGTGFLLFRPCRWWVGGNFSRIGCKISYWFHEYQVEAIENHVQNNHLCAPTVLTKIGFYHCYCYKWRLLAI